MDRWPWNPLLLPLHDEPDPRSMAEFFRQKLAVLADNVAGRVQGSVYGPISKDCRVEGSSQVWISCPLPDCHPDLNDGVLFKEMSLQFQRKD